MPVIYKTLAEVRLLHEYYLMDSDGSSFFDSTDPVLQQEFLLKRFEKDIPSINEHLDYVLPASGSLHRPSPFVIVIPSYTGFRILTPVIEKKNTDGTIVYTPRHTLPNSISIRMNAKTPGLNGITNLRMQRNISSALYFSNYDLATEKSFPFLSAGPGPHVPGSAYEQGELAAFGTNDIRQFFMTDLGFQWRSVTGNGFVSENDRMLLPLKFTYHFNTDNITTARFHLKSSNGSPVKTVEFSSTTPAKNCMVDFSSAPVKTTDSQGIPAELVYLLEVEANDGYSQSHRLIFLEDSVDFGDTWGMMNLQLTATNSDFSILDNEGYLKTRKNAGGYTVGTPVFDIRLKSKFTYWRYTNNRRRKLGVSGLTRDFLDDTDRAGRLVSKSPKELTYLPGLFKKPAGNDFQHLPNPVRNGMFLNENGRIYSDIIVPESSLFPVRP
ncbi:MAG TPA: hypothetical protein VGO58_02750 [Chitinophagaceae bacterium]|jgi:hypothetical protein|nr:hypothetical protein [Chitinophagaceae bacterium]